MFKIIKLIIFILVVALILSAILYWQGVNQPFDKKGVDISFIIEPGEGVGKIAANLEEAGLISSPFYFKLYIWRTDVQNKLQAGEYFLNPNMPIKEITEVFVQGEALSRERTIKIIEGWTLGDIDVYLKANNFIEDDTFIKTAMSGVNNWQYSFDKADFLDSVPAGVDIEGYLFPDTYRVFRDATADDITKKFLDNFDSKLNPELREEINKQGKSIHEIMTTASILEKEVKHDSDRAIVAGVLYKRINIGMRLEVDSSINYITGKNDPSATYVDLEIDSPYNTYKNYGLPPGPICNPGLEAIEAAIYPQDSEYLFYLNRQDTGETIFSKTFEEHVVNKNKYLK